MLEHVLEWCAGLFGVTVRARTGHVVLAFALLALSAIVSVELWGAFGLLLPLALLVLAANAAQLVVRAREAAWRAACLPLDDPRQLPKPDATSADLPFTVHTLRQLGTIVNAVRRGEYVDTRASVAQIDRTLLRAEEIRLLEGARALISLGLHDDYTAARVGAAALPTGSEEIDALLGRVVVAQAWREPARLRAIRVAWESAGITAEDDGTLGRLHRLTRLRIDERLLDGVGVAEARDLAGEARAVGDEDLAADLESRARERAYR